MTTLVWFRQDLRISDNTALAYAAARGPIAPVYILDETGDPHNRPIGGASRWWLHESLTALSRSLGGLVLARGDPVLLLPEIVHNTAASAVFWNRCYEPHAIARDTKIKSDLQARGIEVRSFNANLLFEPWQIRTSDARPFKVFSPFWRTCVRSPVDPPQPAPTPTVAVIKNIGEELSAWDLLPSRPNWAKHFKSEWTPGEQGAQTRLKNFFDHGIIGYSELRNRPDLPNVSRLSPHLHWGEISPRQVWATTQARAATGAIPHKDAEKFLSELGWREFANHLLYHFPELPTRNWKPAFDTFPWRQDQGRLRAWQSGQTGYPFVDAGMRELWATGYMHNRARMVAASFLIKHLQIDWRDGERWFWDTLVDADLANNSAGWQWVAGSGADAAPYFRIFNPIQQGRKFDPEGAYVRHWCPELARLPKAFIHAPFEAPPEVLKASGVSLGRTYPHPIVDHAEARQAALEAYKAMSNACAGVRPEISETSPDLTDASGVADHRNRRMKRAPA